MLIIRNLSYACERGDFDLFGAVFVTDSIDSLQGTEPSCLRTIIYGSIIQCYIIIKVDTYRKISESLSQRIPLKVFAIKKEHQCRF